MREEYLISLNFLLCGLLLILEQHAIELLAGLAFKLPLIDLRHFNINNNSIALSSSVRERTSAHGFGLWLGTLPPSSPYGIAPRV